MHSAAKKQPKEPAFATIALLREFVDVVPQPVFAKDDGHRFIALNEAMCELMGHPREEVLGRMDWDFQPANIAEIYIANDRSVLDSGTPSESEEHFIDAKGRNRTIITRKMRLVGPDGTRVVIGCITDISDIRDALTELQLNSAARISAEQALEEQNHRFDAALNNFPHGLCLFDDQKRLIICNSAYAKMYALPADLTRVGTPLQSILDYRLSNGSAPSNLDSYFDVIDVSKAAGRFASTLTELQDGRIVKITVNSMATGYVATHEDITETVKADRRVSQLADEVRTEHEKLVAALSNIPNGLCMFDATLHLIVCNARYAEMYALPANLLKPGTPLQSIVDYRHQIGNGPKDFPDYVTHYNPETPEGVTVEVELEDGRTIRISRLCLSGGGYVASHEDLTETIRAKTRLSHLATHDALTNLPNRLLLRDRLGTVLGAASPESRVAVLHLKLDHFKGINDSLGHSVGDSLLCAAADRLRGLAAEGDVVARFGDNEFALTQVGRDQPGGSTALAQRVVETLGAVFHLNGHHLEIGASIGIAVAPEDGTDPDQLLRNAGIALDRALADGGGTYRYFEPAMQAKMQRRRWLDAGLRRALENEEFELHYQPILNLGSGLVTGFEALLRWRDRENGLVLPGEFIPYAEDSKLIVPIGEWAIRQACSDAAKWSDDLHVAVNLSPIQFGSGSLVETVFGALAASKLPPGRLELEITESTLLQDSEVALAGLHRLRGFGVRISMDDFGTGYSSLSYLRSFPFDNIKIDQSFIRDLPHSKDSNAIVKAVSGLGASLGITTTAEGIETLEQLEALQAVGCTEGQGYLFGRPCPFAQLTNQLRDLKWPGRIAA